MRVTLLWTVAATAVGVAAIVIALLSSGGPPRGYGDARIEAVFQDCSECPEMLPLAPGSYRMGMEDGGRAYLMATLGLAQSARKDVTIGYSLAVSRHEITFAQWGACVADGGCGEYQPPDEGWGRESRPVIHVSWNDAQAYVRWLSDETGHAYRLLTEAEWEYAARAGSTGAYAWGATAGHAWANYGAPDCPPCTGRVEGADQWLNTAPVGSFPPNAFGLFDMSGNVYEWVQDCSMQDLPREPANGAAFEMEACENRVIRGGAWYSDPHRVRSAYRAYNTPDRRDPVIGFRVARAL